MAAAKTDRETLLADLQRLVQVLKADLLERSREVPEIETGLRAAHEAIASGKRTAQSYEEWRDDYLEQVAVAWVLACVFVRYMEDNDLIAQTYLAGTGDRRRQAEDAQEGYFRARPRDTTDRDYLLDVFRKVGSIPAARDLFAEGKTPIWAVGPSGDGAARLLAFWREIDPEAGGLKRSLKVDGGDTRFLGDLYQDLSEAARKKYALLQTPDFVEEFILDHTLTPALDEFGLETVRLIDPTCGSGHFLLGAFRRLFRLWSEREPGTEPTVLAQRALEAVYGIDVNPFAVAIARFRLVVEAMHLCDVHRLNKAPGWAVHVAFGDSLMHGDRFDARGFRKQWLPGEESWSDPVYALEDPVGLHEILSRQYHAVVGNPPYITVKDATLSDRYRQRWDTCHRQYSLGVPFTERFFDLALARDNVGQPPSAGGISADDSRGRLSHNQTGSALARDNVGQPPSAGGISADDSRGRLSHNQTGSALARDNVGQPPSAGGISADDSRGRLSHNQTGSALARDNVGQPPSAGGISADDSRGRLSHNQTGSALARDNVGQPPSAGGISADDSRGRLSHNQTGSALARDNVGQPPSAGGISADDSRGRLSHNKTGSGAGFVGMITANSFMKREFGKKLIERFFPTVDLTHVIDTSGAYIPGHGTPTVILYGRNRPPTTDTIRAVLGIRGEPTTPADPVQGRVWRSIVDHIDNGQAQNEFVSVTDAARATFGKHPWSIGGGGAAGLKLTIEEAVAALLKDRIADIGRTTHTGEDDVFYLPTNVAIIKGLARFAVPLVIGEGLRDWELNYDMLTLFPYDRSNAEPVEIDSPAWAHHFWPFRRTLKNRMDFGNHIEERGLRWFDHSMFFPARFRNPLSIAFAFVATHNHFVLDRGGKVFNRSAPIIKLPADATEDDHLALLGLLNSSMACFWMKQSFQTKGSSGIGRGVYDERWEFFYEYTGTGVGAFPVLDSRTDALPLSRKLDALARELMALSPSELARRERAAFAMLESNRKETERLQSRMVALQEELDWLCYRLYGLIEADDAVGIVLDFGPNGETAEGGCPTQVGPDVHSVGQPPSAVIPAPDVHSVGQPPSAVIPAPDVHSVGQPPSAVIPTDRPRARPTASEYRRKLPHIQAEGKTLEVTFCTRDRWVLPESVRDRVLEHCLHDDGVKLHLHAAVVMPDHVHLLFTPLVDADGNTYGLAEIMSGIKGASAHSVNRMLGRKGSVWQDESFDHILRSDEQIEAKAHYIGQNPVRKNLTARQEDYQWLWREGIEGKIQETAGGGCPTGIPELALGERTFEIAMARQVAAGELQTSWFERHGSTPITEIPGHWPEAYRALVERRLEAIRDNPNIALIERPEYKRRWSREPWDEQVQRALRSWLLDRLVGRQTSIDG